MPRIAATSDLHFDANGQLTAPAKVRAVVDAMVASGADAIVVAGDIGHPLANYRGCLDLFADCRIPVGVVAGNHDVWRDQHHDSRSLLEEVLPVASRQRGCHWLEQDRIVIGSTAIVGSMVWYDYSGAESLGLEPSYFADAKPRISNDALWVDWVWSDPEAAGMLRIGLRTTLEELERDASIHRVVVVTHVPVFEGQMLRNPDNFAWSVANAYFGNLRTGRAIARFPKVRVVISGHIHTSLTTTVSRTHMADIHAFVVGSDYGDPDWVLVDV
jgi:predicted phosphohydrolase